MTAASPATRASLSRALEYAFGFTYESVGENRLGKLASNQKLRLFERVFKTAGAGALAVFIWLALWLVYSSIVLKVPVDDAIGEVFTRVLNPQLIWHTQFFGVYDKTPRTYSAVAISLILLVAFGIFLLPFRLIRDILEGAVCQNLGRIEIEEGENLKRGQPDGKVRYYYRLRDLGKFEVSKAAYDAIDAGGIYAVYYVPRSRLIVAVEPRMESERIPIPLSERPFSAARLLS